MEQKRKLLFNQKDVNQIVKKEIEKRDKYWKEEIKKLKKERNITNDMTAYQAGYRAALLHERKQRLHHLELKEQIHSRAILFMQSIEDCEWLTTKLASIIDDEIDFL